jgi:hypothetical protein
MEGAGKARRTRHGCLFRTYRLDQGIDMEDHEKTREQLISELTAIREKAAAMEKRLADGRR